MLKQVISKATVLPGVKGEPKTALKSDVKRMLARNDLRRGDQRSALERSG